MAYLRRSKKIFNRKGVRGDETLTNESVNQATPDGQDDQDIALAEAIYDEAVRVELLYEAEETLSKFEDLVDEQLKEIAILLDPDVQFNLVQAVTTLAGEPKLVLDGDIIKMAADLGMDGSIHLNGYDPVAAILGLYGGDERPNVPSPDLFMDCDEMANLQNMPSPGDDNFMTSDIEEVHVEVEKAKTLKIYQKLWKIFKYFPGVDIKSFLKKIRNRWTKRPVNRAIRWVECRMINPGWFLLTGEARSCKPGEEADEELEGDEVYHLNADDFEGTGLDCMEASGLILQYVERNLSKDEAVKNMVIAMDERAMHESRKFANLHGRLKHPKMHAQKVKEMNDKTKEIPRYKKRFYDFKDTFIKADLGKDVIMKDLRG